MPTAGYVNLEDVNLSLLDYSDILTKELSEIPTNSYTWLATEKNQQTWGVYKHVNENTQILSVGKADGTSFHYYT